LRLACFLDEETCMSNVSSATAIAHPNLALIKYWGQSDLERNLPANDSLSVNLSGARTRTCVTFDPALTADVVTLNGTPADPPIAARVSAHLDRVRVWAKNTLHARVNSHNDFPTGAGIASSASAFAALSLAASHAAGLTPDPAALSRLARLGSGSACRSVPDGFAYWPAGTDKDSYARQLVPASHWPELRILTVYFPEAPPKLMSSLAGHRAAPTSPFYQTRLARVPKCLDQVRTALLKRDLEALGPLVEREAISLHTIAMTSHLAGRPKWSGIYYWRPETLALVRAVQEWRQETVQVYFTLDAGPSVHLLFESKTQSQIETRLTPLLERHHAAFFVSQPGRGVHPVK
jgi:diphosphomevalonate decarboxylase